MAHAGSVESTSADAEDGSGSTMAHAGSFDGTGAASGWEHDMQGTVRSFDPSDGSGSVFLDDGSVCEFGPDVFAASGLRLLRRGQRVTIRRGSSGAITALTLVTFPLPAGPERKP
jgi:cold shock CspA family protein